MATLASIITALETKFETLTSGTETTIKYADTDVIAAGAMKYQIQAQLDTTDSGDSNVTYEVGRIQLIVNYHLAAWNAEDTYTHGDMLTWQSAVMDEDWWIAIAGIYDMEEGPELSTDVERVGNVIRWAVLVQFQIVPT